MPPGLTRAAALTYAAQNLRVNSICAGCIDTPIMGRFTSGTPEGARFRLMGPARLVGNQVATVDYCIQSIRFET